MLSGMTFLVTLAESATLIYVFPDSCIPIVRHGFWWIALFGHFSSHLLSKQKPKGWISPLRRRKTAASAKSRFLQLYPVSGFDFMNVDLHMKFSFSVLCYPFSCGCFTLVISRNICVISSKPRTSLIFFWAMCINNNADELHPFMSSVFKKN